ncbi:unnamed protein product [Closterium sp. NIES-64]|nr:unnamed protein product [Closterium sp. NIES-64]
MIDHEPVAMRAVEDDGTLPRYSQDELRRMTCDWRTKLGEGGFGAVYKGMLLLPHGGARGGGYGEGVGGGWGERDHEEEVQGGMGPGINDDLEVVQVGGKEFVPVAVKMCFSDNAEGGAREQLLTEIIPMTALHAFSLSLPFPSPSINPLHPSFSYGDTGTIMIALHHTIVPSPSSPLFPDLRDSPRPAIRWRYCNDCPALHHPNILRLLGVAVMGRTIRRPPLPRPPCTHPCRDAPPLSSPLPSSPSPPFRHFHPVSPPSPLPHQTEVMMMTAVHHPNILRLLGVAVMGQTLAMVSEFVPGGDVSQRLKKARSDTEPFPWKDRLRIARGSLEGLAAIHREGFIHRDFKSANVLLTKTLVPKVADFGLAKACQDKTHVTTRVAGSWGYMDPDYFERGILSSHCDTYAFGVFLLELVTGRGVLDESFQMKRRHLRNLAFADYAELFDKKLEGQWTEEQAEVLVGMMRDAIQSDWAHRPTTDQLLVTWNEHLCLEE